MRYYMIVTNDVYELPLSAPLTPLQVAERLGIKVDTVRWYGTHAGKKRDKNRRQRRIPYKIVAVELDDEEIK